MSTIDSVRSVVLNRVRKVARDGDCVTSGGRQFHTGGWSGKLKVVQGSRCRKCEFFGDLEGGQRS